MCIYVGLQGSIHWLRKSHATLRDTQREREREVCLYMYVYTYAHAYMNVDVCAHKIHRYRRLPEGKPFESQLQKFNA